MQHYVINYVRDLRGGGCRWFSVSTLISSWGRHGRDHMVVGFTTLPICNQYL
jgi:hypothetical protein